METKTSHGWGCKPPEVLYCFACFCSLRRGAEMTQRTRKPNPLSEIVRSQAEEIKKYKWIESEKAGRDIGWERATREWMQKYLDRKSTRLNSSHVSESRMPSSA